jgi:hypothetical protein
MGKKVIRMSNYRAPLDAGNAVCYLSSITGPARVSAGCWAVHCDLVV